jgi:plastocyanin
MTIREHARFRDIAVRGAVLCLGITVLLGLSMSRQAAHAQTPAAATRLATVESPQVAIANFAFSPATLTVASGTTVTWTNQDDMVHTVTAADRAFSSTGLETGGTYAHTFTAPGTYTYFCALHPRMTATVIVQ